MQKLSVYSRLLVSLLNNVVLQGQMINYLSLIVFHMSGLGYL